jgi:DNA-binding response OmpR family regulator
VVDDDPDIRELFARAFEPHGYTVDTASSCREADARISRVPYDSIILDVRLPDDSGLAFYYRLKGRRPDLARRVVLLTGAIEFHPQLGFLRDEGRAVLLKPVSISEVLVVLKRTS